MLYSQGISLGALGIRNRDADPRESWRLFAQNYHLFRGTPSRMWMDWVFAEAFGFDVQFAAETSDLITTGSPRRWRPTPSARARCSTASGSR